MSAYNDAMAAIAHRAYAEGRHAEAEATLRLAVGSAATSAHSVYFLGHLCYLQGRLREAEAYLTMSIELDPDNGRARNDLGETLRAMGRDREALHHLERAVALEPGLAHSYGNLAAALVALGRPDEALRRAQESLWRADDKAVAHCDLGSIFGRLGRYKEAMRQYRLSLDIAPDNPRAAYFDSLMRLSTGELPDAWTAHEQRLRLPLSLIGRRQYAAPRWSGETGIQGRTVLLHAEQGFGDTIQFARYAASVAELGASVVLEVQPGLGSLLDGIGGAARVVETGDDMPGFDLHCPVMSLPAAFRTALDTIPGRAPYLSARADRAAAWRRDLGDGTKMRVGLAWSGSPGHANDRARSLPLHRLRGLLERPDIEWHVLQRDIRPSDRDALREAGSLIDHSARLTDWAETAALASRMDLIVSVDTAVAHLAGALGKPTWVLLPHAADWRWMAGRADSPWYPSMRLFRQPKRDDWTTVLADIGRQLDPWAAPRG